jgi:hypothetical protein
MRQQGLRLSNERHPSRTGKRTFDSFNVSCAGDRGGNERTIQPLKAVSQPSAIFTATHLEQMLE